MGLTAGDVLERAGDVKMTAEELAEEVKQVMARVNREHAELVRLTERLLLDQLWGGGYRSPEHWLVVVAGLSSTRACEVVRLARRRAELPRCIESFEAGRLSLEQAATLARLAPTTHDASTTELAENATVPQLRRALARYQFEEPVADGSAGENDTPDEAESQQQAGPEDKAGARAEAERRCLALAELSMGTDEFGRFLLRFSAPPDVGAVVEQALLEARNALFLATTADDQSAAAQPLGQDDATGEQRCFTVPASLESANVSLAEALVEVARRSLASVPNAARRSQYRVYLHVGENGAAINGRQVPLAVVDRWLCQESVQPVWMRQGEPVSVGRARRIVPDRTRRLIFYRDQGCRFPGCAAARYVEVHHLVPWSEGGTTDYRTNISLCPFHHRALHRGDFSVTGDPSQVPAAGQADGLTFRSSKGLRIGASSRSVVPSPSRPDPPRYAGPTGERLQWKWVSFARNG